MTGRWVLLSRSGRRRIGWVFVVAMVVLVACTRLAAQTEEPIRAWLASEKSMPVAVYRLFPNYTPAPGMQIPNGAVEVEAVVGVDGRVAHARVVTSLAEVFDQASLGAIRRWRFRPAERSGRPVASLVGVRFTFLPPRRAGGAPEVTGMVGLLPPHPLPSPAAPIEAVPMRPTSGLRAARPLREITPAYTDEAMRRKIQGDVEVELTILADGTVGATRVRRSLDGETGLDEQALIAARYWLFEPATLNGQPVASTSVLMLTFRVY